MQAFGHPTQIISRVGQDSLGQQALLGIQKLGLSTSCIQEDTHQPTGTVEIQLDAFGNADYHILQSVAYDDIILPNETELLVPRAKFFISEPGSALSLRARQTLKQIVAILPEDAMIVYVSISEKTATQGNHSCLSGNGPMDEMQCEEESRWVADTFELKANSLPERAVEILERWHLEGVVMTLGSKGALAVTCSGQIVYQPGFQVQALETIGAGDATTAAFVHHWLAKDPLPFLPEKRMCPWIHGDHPAWGNSIHLHERVESMDTHRPLASDGSHAGTMVQKPLKNDSNLPLIS